MLFIQSITLRYEKDVRYANFANQRRSVRFWELPQACPEENEVLFHAVFLGQDTQKLGCYRNSLKSCGAEVFYDGKWNQTPFSDRIAVAKEADSFRIKYRGKSDRGFYSTKMILRPGEYGRIIFNERNIYPYSGIWYYDMMTYNFINLPFSAYRQKLFYRKEPDHIFQDMQYLRYSS